MDKYLFYVGKDKGSLLGVPARDLSYEEAKKHGITNLLASGLYVYNSQHAIPLEYQKLLNVAQVEDEPVKKTKKRSKRSVNND